MYVKRLGQQAEKFLFAVNNKRNQSTTGAVVSRLFFVFLIIIVRKRSLGQGNVFTLVCHSVHGGGGRGVCIPACNGAAGCVSQHAIGQGL